MIDGIKTFDLNYPGRIIFGNGSAGRLPDVLPHEGKVMLLSGPNTAKSKAFEETKDILCEFDIADASGMCSPEPSIDIVRDIIAFGRQNKVKSVVAIGGGSAIDAAKAAAGIIPTKNDIADYFKGTVKITGKGLFLAALPTTAGSGAEITPNSVITDPGSKIKKSIRHNLLIPDAAIIDPELTLGTPPHVTACSGLDALVQAIESYTSSSANPVSKPLAKAAVPLILRSIVNACSDGGDLTHRENMAAASLLSALSFSQAGLGAVHGIAHPVGSLLTIPHGMACAILIVPIMKFNSETCSKSYSELAAASGLSPLPEALINKICGIRKKLSIPENFKRFKLDRSHFPFIIRNCRSRSMECNPKHMQDDDVWKILSDLT
ncbi:MAG: iron-containing alcohol dehydrogenase [Victivallales bacterium]|nr:iron-containing alcohol dehydrogenase [Victivallales bacterium]